MASPYTQDITKSKVYKKLTGQDEKPIDQFISGLQELKTLGDSKVADNIKDLQDSNTFEIQQKKNQLKNLNQVSKIQETINSQYGGNVSMWAMDYAKNDYENTVFSKFSMDDITGNKLELQPDEAYGDVLKTRAANIENRWNNIVNNLDSAGIPYQDLEKGQTFIDKEYQNVYDGLTKNNSFNVLKGVGSLFKGQGFNYTDAESLKSQFKENINKSNISLIEKVNTEFKALYSLSPSLADDYKRIVKNADVRSEIVFKETAEKTATRYNKKGEKEEYTYFELIKSYKDKDGKRQTEVERIETDGTVVPEKGNINKHMLNLTLYTEEGKATYRGLMEEGFNPDAANEQIPEGQRITMDSLRIQKYVEDNALKLQESINDTYYTTDIAGTVMQINPLEKVPTLREYAAEILNISEIDINPTNKINTNTFEIDNNLNESTKNYLQTEEGNKILIDVKEVILPTSDEDKIIKQYTDKDFDSNLTPSGIYYGAEEQILDDPETLEQFGFKKPQIVGVNLKTMKLVFTELDEFKSSTDKFKTSFEIDRDEGIKRRDKIKDVKVSKEKNIKDFQNAINLIKSDTIADNVISYFGLNQNEKELREEKKPLWGILKQNYNLNRQDLLGLRGRMFAENNPQLANEITDLIINFKPE